MEKFFNYHNLLQANISGQSRALTRYFINELEHGKLINNNDNITPIINIRIDELPQIKLPVWALGKGMFYSETDNVILFSKDKSTSFYRSSDIYAHITNLVENTPESINVYLNPDVIIKKNYIRKLFSNIIKPRPFSVEQKFAENFFSQFLEPIFYRGFLKSNHLLLHAAGLESNGKGILIFGPQNIGKTSLTITLARKGWRVHGDDMCILSNNGTIYSHAKPLKLENEYLSKTTKDYKRLWADSYSTDINIISNINYKLGRFGKFEFKVPVNSLGIDTSQKSKINAVFFLQRCYRGNSAKPVQIHKITPQRALSIAKQHMATEFDVNKRIDRDIRYTYALYNKNETMLSLVSKSSNDILKNSLASVQSYLINITEPNVNVANAIEELFEQYND